MEYLEMNFLALKMKLELPIAVESIPSKGKIFEHFRRLKQKMNRSSQRL
jgi:hypothetical protein